MPQDRSMISVFQNDAGSITLQIATKGDDFELCEILMVTIPVHELREVAAIICEMALEIEEGEEQ